jgi:hypothetical protein
LLDDVALARFLGVAVLAGAEAGEDSLEDDRQLPERRR